MTDKDEPQATGTFSRLMQDKGANEAEPPHEPTNERSSERTNGRTDDGANEPSNGRKSEPSNGRTEPTHQIIIPAKREKLRWSFDVFRDQRTALDTLQFAATEKGGNKESVGTLVQRALDAFIKQEAKRLGNVAVKREARD